MVLEILGGALLGRAISKRRKTGTELALAADIYKDTNPADPEDPDKAVKYAVVFEDTGGNGNGAWSIVYLTSNMEEALAWAWSATRCARLMLKGSGIQEYGGGVPMSSRGDGVQGVAPNEDCLTTFVVSNSERSISYSVVRYF